MLQKERASNYKESVAFKTAFDLPLQTSINRLQGIRRTFHNVAFIGPNPYYFLEHLPFKNEVDKFYICEPSEASLQKSYDIIMNRINNGFYEKAGVNIPSEIIPVIVDEETEWL